MSEEMIACIEALGAGPLPPMTDGFRVLDLGLAVDRGLARVDAAALAGAPADSADVLVGTGIVSAAADKEALLADAFGVLAYGGELYVTDVFCDRRLSAAQKADPALAGTLAGAAYYEDFRRLMRAAGWEDFRTVASQPLPLDAAEAAAAGDAGFTVRTIRAVKAPDKIEDICEQYGQQATYLGTIEGLPDYFDLDAGHRFVTGEPLAVCGNSCAMVQDTRFGAHFKVDGDRSVHYGPFAGC